MNIKNIIEIEKIEKIEGNNFQIKFNYTKDEFNEIINSSNFFWNMLKVT